MAFNGSGTFSVYTPGNPAVTGTTISSTAYNNTMNDFASGLSNCVTRDGQSPATSNLPMGGNKLTGLGNGSARTDSVNLGQVQDNTLSYLTSVSGTNTVTASLNGLAAYATGMEVSFISAGANTGAVTLNINGLGAKSITKNGTTALIAGDIPSGAAVQLVYDGTQFQLLSGGAASYAQSGANSDITSLLNSGGIQVATRTDVASSSTVSLTGNPDDIRITGTTTITGFTAVVGRVVRVTFSGSLTLTNNANIVTQTGANITTQAGDTCVLRATAANTVEVLFYKSVSQITLGTSVATTSGTSIDFTSIPSWVKRITVIFNGVSTSGTSTVQIQVGNGSFVSSGYASAASSQRLANTSGATTITTGFVAVYNQASAAAVYSGHLVLIQISSNLWVESGNLVATGSGDSTQSAGNVSLGGALDRIRLTTVGGTDTFDAGSVNILYE